MFSQEAYPQPVFSGRTIPSLPQNGATAPRKTLERALMIPASHEPPFGMLWRRVALVSDIARLDTELFSGADRRLNC